VDVLACCIVSMHECILHFVPAAAGKCSVFASGDGDVAFCQITFDIATPFKPLNQSVMNTVMYNVYIFRV